MFKKNFRSLGNSDTDIFEELEGSFRSAKILLKGFRKPFKTSGIQKYSQEIENCRNEELQSIYLTFLICRLFV